MSNLDDLKKNALPPSSEDDATSNVGPVEYVPAMGRKELDPTTLGEPPAPPKPNIMDRMMADLDRAIERDKRQMKKNVIDPAMEAYMNNQRFGKGGADAYYEGEIGEDIPQMDGNSKAGQRDYNSQHTTAPIEMSKEDAARLQTVSGGSYMDSQKTDVTVDEEDDFLNDDSIYEREEPQMQVNDDYNKIAPQHTPIDTQISTDVIPGDYMATHQMPVKDEPITDRPINIPKADYTYKFIDEAFGDDTDNSTDLSEVDKEDLKAMRDVVRDNIKPVNNIIDLAAVRISDKPITAGRVLSLLDTSLPTAKWVLPATGTTFIISALRGTEIELLANRRQGQTDLMRNQEIVQTFYNHLATDKPSSWEAWAKSVIYDDFIHLYFGVYMACFTNANFAPFECDSCKHSFMDRITFDGMIKYKDEDAEHKVKALLQTDPKTGSTNVVLKQVSDRVVIAFRKPTIWNAMFEDLYLPEKVRNQMRDIVGVFRHISNVYIYDRGELRPIDTKPVAGDMAKTLKNKFKIYYDVLRSLTSDQLTAITSIINDLHKDGDLITYQYPEFKCPKCGHVTPAREEEPINILFLRHQLQNILLS